MAGFSRAQLEAYRGASVPDLLGEEIDLLFVGINPGLWTAATGTHFCHPSNRFYPALRQAGIIDWEMDPNAGMTDEQRLSLMERGVGITNLVNRATVRASELGRAELIEGAGRLSSLVEELGPKVVAVSGITAYREAFGDKRAMLGRQPDGIGKSEVWVVPNPSGLNAHETVDTLAAWFRRVADAAGIA